MAYRTKKGKVWVAKPRYCSVCGKPGHDKRKCLKPATDLIADRFGNAKDPEDIEAMGSEYVNRLAHMDSVPWVPNEKLRFFYSVEKHIMEIANLAAQIRRHRQVGNSMWAMKDIEAAIEEARLLTELLGAHE